MRKTTWAMAATAAVLASCDILRDPTPLGPLEQVVAVHAVLHAGSDTARVLITRGWTESVEGLGTPDPVSGADVRLGTPSGEVAFREADPLLGPCLRGYGYIQGEPPLDEPRPGCYAAVLPATVRPGERYDLAITLPDGGNVRGSAVVPAPVELSGVPPEGAKLPAWGSDAPSVPPTGIEVDWVRGENAASVEFEFGSYHAVYAGGAQVVGARCDLYPSLSPFRSKAGAGSFSLSFRYGVRCMIDVQRDDGTDWQTVDWDSIRVSVLVAAYDTAYSRFNDEVLTSGAVALDRASVGVTGAAGVFGAVAPLELPVLLVRQRP